jgi:hypothetical protein
MKPSDDLKREFTKDKNAETIQDLVKVTGLADTTIRRHAKKMIAQNIWKEVYKKTDAGICKAYIKIR